MLKEVSAILEERFEPLWAVMQYAKLEKSSLNLAIFSYGFEQTVVLHSYYNQRQIIKALDTGTRVFLLDEDLCKIYTFLLQEGVERILKHPFFLIFHLGSEQIALNIVRKIIPDTCKFIGKSPIFKKVSNAYYDLVLALADQEDFFSQKLINIQKNLLENESFYDFAPLKNRYANTEVLLIGSGPSFVKNIKEIKALQESCIIIACGSSIFTLYEQNIEPDFLVYIDPNPLKKAHSMNKISDKPLFMSLRSSCDFVTKHKGKKILVPHDCSELQNWYKRELGLDQNSFEIGSSAGSMGAAVCKKMGFKKLYCIGFDAKQKIDHKRAKDFMRSLRSNEFSCVFTLPKSKAERKKIWGLKTKYCVERKKVIKLHQKFFRSMETLEDEIFEILNLRKAKRTIVALLESSFNRSLFYQEYIKEPCDLFFDTRIGLDVALEKGFFAIDVIKRVKTCKNQIL